MNKKWAKWLVGITGASSLAVTLGLIQLNQEVDVGEQVELFNSLPLENSLVKQDMILLKTLENNQRRQFVEKPYFVSYDYSKAGYSEKEFVQYLQEKEELLASLDWGETVVPEQRTTSTIIPSQKSDRKTRGSR